MKNDIYNVFDHNHIPEDADAKDRYLKDLGTNLKLVMMNNQKRATFFRAICYEFTDPVPHSDEMPQFERELLDDLLGFKGSMWDLFAGKIKKMCEEENLSLDTLTEDHFIRLVVDDPRLDYQRFKDRHDKDEVNAGENWLVEYKLVWFLSLMTRQAHLRCGAMPMKISDDYGNNYVLSIEESSDFNEPSLLSSLTSLFSTPRRGIKINGCNSKFEPRYIIVYDDGTIKGHGGNTQLGVVEKQLAANRETIIDHFNNHRKDENVELNSSSQNNPSNA